MFKGLIFLTLKKYWNRNTYSEKKNKYGFAESNLYKIFFFFRFEAWKMRLFLYILLWKWTCSFMNLSFITKDYVKVLLFYLWESEFFIHVLILHVQKIMIYQCESNFIIYMKASFLNNVKVHLSTWKWFSCLCESEFIYVKVRLLGCESDFNYPWESEFIYPCESESNYLCESQFIWQCGKRVPFFLSQ